MDDNKRVEQALGIIAGFENGLYQAEGPKGVIEKIKETLTPEPTWKFKFLYFKESGKWAYEGKGVLPKSAFAYRKPSEFCEIVLRYNEGKWPGVNLIDYHDYTVVVTHFDDDEENPEAFGYPLLYKAGSFSS